MFLLQMILFSKHLMSPRLKTLAWRRKGKEEGATGGRPGENAVEGEEERRKGEKVKGILRRWERECWKLQEPN